MYFILRKFLNINSDVKVMVYFNTWGFMAFILHLAFNLYQYFNTK
jgi:hypothetical protein